MKRSKSNSRSGVRLIFKILLVLAVFAGSLIFFGSGIKETLFDNKQKMTEMKAASFPYISMITAGREINLLHGYAANLDSQVIRECITPVTEDRSVTVKIKENGSDVKKLKYEIYTIDGNAKEEGNFTLLADSDGGKRAKIDLTDNYESGAEYILKLTLITNSSKRIYYYTRLKLYEKGKLDEKLDFIINFHKTLLDPNGKRAEDLMDWLEPNRNSAHSSFANVNIKSRLNLVSYGSLEPELVYEQIPTITEFYENYASVRLDYVLSVQTGARVEYYRMEEDYRIGLSGNKTYLYNYERKMEEFFDIDNFSAVKREFKLGITEENPAETFLSPNGKYMAFVYGGELIFYDIENNIAVKVFSFGSKERDFEKELYRKYDIKVLRILDDGSIDFFVNGYMNAGEYEGRVGIVLYNYDNSMKALEEKLYMPINCSYEVLNQDLSDFAYMDDKQILYFSIYGNVYAYDLASAHLELVTSGVGEGEMVFCEEENYLVWTVHGVNGESKSLKILHLDSGEEYVIESPDKLIRLFGSINNNIVYGFERESDGVRLRNGTIERPCYKMLIADGEGKVLKTYEQNGMFISDVEIGENIVTINRVVKNETSGAYEKTDSDTVLNKLDIRESAVPVVKNMDDRLLTEFYVSVPGTEPIPAKPELQTTVNKVLNRETIARLPEAEKSDSCYYAYSFGRIVESSKHAAEAIYAADKYVGTVINREGKVIWERGVKMPRTEIVDITEIKADQGHDSIQASMEMLAGYRGVEIDTSGFDQTRESIYGFLSKNMKPSVIDMTGAELDEVLYSVYRKHPVLAVKGNGEACVLLGYDPSNVIIYEPSKGRRSSMAISDAIKEFNISGNIFISYV